MNLKKSVKHPDDSFDGFSSVFSTKENHLSSANHKKSKAYAAAMKALQEKLQELEIENSSLSQKLSETESKRQSDRHNFDLQQQEDRLRYEKLLKQKINDLDQQEKISQKGLKKLQDSIKISEIKLKFNEEQVTRLNEQLQLDKENFQLETECLKKALADAKASEKDLNEALLREKKAKKLLKDQIIEQEKLVESLKEEVEYLKDHNKEHKIRLEENFKSIKSELILKNQENLAMIKQLNLKNKNLQRLANDSKKQGDFYKIQCIKLSQKARESQDLAKEMKKSRSKSRISEGKATNRRSVSSLRLSETPDFTEEACIGKAINSKEFEIKKLSDRYQKLQSLQFDTSELESFQQNLEEICVNMEKKNRELSELKKKQRESLKLRLVG
jgi:hypothetical protein